MKVGLRKNRVIRFFAAGVAAAAMVLSSCANFGMDENSFQNKVSAYFKEMTNNAAVAAYELDPANAPTDKFGNLCFPFDQDCKVTLLLRNPQRYHFTAGSNMEFSMAGESGASPIWSDASMVTIEQDASDPSKIYVTYPSNFLMAHPLGDDISPVVRLYHPVSHASFGVYDKLKLSSNAPPPSPNGAVVMQTNSATGSKWVVCFNMPGSSFINNYHSDITSVSVNGASFDTSITTGSISYPTGGTTLKTSVSSSELADNQKTGSHFATDGQPAYFMTDDIADETERVYTITVTDSAGLSSSVAVSAQGYKLSAPDAYLVGGTAAFSKSTPAAASSAAKNSVGQEEDGSAWITIRALAKTAAVRYTKIDGTTASTESVDYDPSNASLVYELYSGPTLNTTTLLRTGTLSGVSGNISIPAGTSYVKAFVRKPLYADSEAIVWNCRAVCTNLFVSASGDDGAGGEGSRAKPYRTIQRAIKQFQDGLTAAEPDYGANTTLNIRVLTDITPPADFNWSANSNSFANVYFGAVTLPSNLVLNIKGEGGRRTISGGQNVSEISSRLRRVMYVNAGTVNIEDINITGGYYSSGSDQNGGGLCISGGTVTYKNGAVYGNFAGSGAGVYVGSGTAHKFENVQVYENARYKEGYGAGISVANSAGLTCNSCVIRDNGYATAPSVGEGGGGVYNNGTFVMNGGSITGNIINPACGGGIYNKSGSVTLANVTMTGNSATSEYGKGGAIYNAAALTLEACTITGNSATEGAGVYNYGSTFTFTLKAGTTKILDNLVPDPADSTKTKQGNVYLNVGDVITIDPGANLGDSRIGVNIPYTASTPESDKPSAGAPKSFTSGYGYPGTNSKKPGLIFVAENGYGVTDNGDDGEAAFAVSGGSMYDPTDFKITAALDSAMAKPNTDKTFNVTITAERKLSDGKFPSEKTPAEAANLVYNLTDHKLYEFGGTVPAAGEGSDNPAVTWSAALYNGGQKIASGASISTNGLTVTVPAAAIPREDTYILKITATYMGYTHDASFPITVTNRIGILTSPSAVGDIVFSDGSAVSYSSGLELTPEQKAAAVAVIFYAGGDTNLGSKILGVGLKEANETKVWTTTSSPCYGDVSVATDKNDGSKNWAAICAKDSAGAASANRATYYPAFAWCLGYGVAVNGETDGWYLPAENELKALVITNKVAVNNALTKIGSSATTIVVTSDTSSVYWSSTTSLTNGNSAVGYNSSRQEQGKAAPRYVRAVRQF